MRNDLVRIDIEQEVWLESEQMKVRSVVIELANVDVVFR